MLGRSLKMAFWILHDHLGKLLIANFIWATAIFVPIGIALPTVYTGDVELILVVGVPMLYIGVFLCAPIFGAGIAHFVKVLIDKRDGALSDFFAGVRMYSLRAAAIGFWYALATTALSTSAWFYSAKLQSTMPLLGYAISALAIWCLTVLGLTALFVLPALVQKKAGVFATLRLTLMLILANPGLALGIGLQTVMLTLTTALLLPLVFAGYGAAVVCIGSAAYELLARKYAPSDSAAPPLDDANDDYLNRGLRDLFFPWKS
jgi:hypothetical protein